MEVIFIAQLKGCLKEVEDCGVRYKIKHMLWQLKYAWQRAWRGYDDTDIFNMDDNLRTKMITMLEKYNETRCGVFFKPNKNTIDDVMTNEETSDIIKKMIELLHKSDEWFYYDDDYELKDGYTYEIVAKRCEESRNEFLDLMKEYGNQLWD